MELERGMAGSGSASSSWAPLRIRLFRTLWIAALVSNVGTWMQTVGAQWLVVHAAHAAILVSLVQTADTLPAVLFALVAGVLADIFDRVKLLVAVLAGMSATGAALTALTAAHRMPPALLLMFTFVLGTGAILVTPAYQSLVPDMVPRPELPAASALGSISINLARAVGPAIAGLLVAQTGVPAVFALNTATFLLYAIVVASHPQLGGTPESPERFLPGLRAGGRYVRNAPVVRRILLRAALFLVPGSSLWALLPLIATRRLALGPGGYGVLLGALGVGASGGAFVLPQIRARLSANAMAAVASLIYAAALVAVVLSRAPTLTILVLLPAGVAWIAFLSNVNAALQLFLPKWVRARGLSVYLMVLFGAQAAGAAIWGAVAGTAGLVPAFLISAAVMAAGGGDHLVLAVPPDRRHGPEPGPLARAAAAHQRRPRRRAGPGAGHVHHRRRKRAAVPAGHGPPAPVAAADRGHRLGSLPRRPEPALVHRTVRRPELGRAPQTAPGAADRHRPPIPRRRRSAIRPTATNRPLPGRRRLRVTRA